MLGVVVTAAGIIFALVGGLIGVLFTRISHLEDRVDKAEAATVRAQSYNRRLWLWARELLDMYYRHRGPDAPNPPPFPEDEDVE